MFSESMVSRDFAPSAADYLNSKNRARADRVIGALKNRLNTKDNRDAYNQVRELYARAFERHLP